VIAAMLGSYVYINLLVMIPGCLYLLVWVAIDTFKLLRRNAWLMLRVAALALAGAAVYFASYVLWTRNVVPDYNLATGMALALSLLTLFIAWLSTREVAGVF
jgi:hypothetical protein